MADTLGMIGGAWTVPGICPIGSLRRRGQSARVAQVSVGVFTQHPSIIPVPLPL